MFKRFRDRRSYQYSRWDGTQSLDDWNAESALDALSDEYLRHGDLRKAMERLRQMGYTTRDGQRRMGMQDLLNRLRERRKQQMQRYDMSGVMDQIQEQLERVKQLEREGIARRLDETATGDQAAKRQMPESVRRMRATTHQSIRNQRADLLARVGRMRALRRMIYGVCLKTSPTVSWPSLTNCQATPLGRFNNCPSTSSWMSRLGKRFKNCLACCSSR